MCASSAQCPIRPGQIGSGITVWTAAPEVGAEERAQGGALLGAMGEHIYANDELFSIWRPRSAAPGPAYVFLFMEALVDAGVHMGFARRDAEKLVTQTLLGSILYAQQSGLHPAQLRNQVTSPGGTTAAASARNGEGRLANRALRRRLGRLSALTGARRRSGLSLAKFFVQAFPCPDGAARAKSSCGIRGTATESQSAPTNRRGHEFHL